MSSSRFSTLRPIGSQNHRRLRKDVDVSGPSSSTSESNSFALSSLSTGTKLDGSRNSPSSCASRQTGLGDELLEASHNQYIERLKELSVYYPHLKNSLAPSRSPHHKYTVIDYHDQVLLTTRSYVSRRAQSHSAAKSRAVFHDLVRGNVSTNLTHRVIVVEGLSTQVIEILGSELEIAPELFEQHLINSGWQDGDYQDCEASTWNTRVMKRPYTSIRWLRPGTSNSPNPLSARIQRDLLQPPGRLSWDESILAPDCNDGLTRYDVRHEVTAATNIIRPSWDLKTYASDKVSSPSQPVVWEERATIWVKQEAQYQISV